MEVTDIRLLLPAMVSFKTDDKDYSVFVYIDQIKKDVIVPDASDILDLDEFKKAFAQFYNKKNPAVKIPTPPSKDFQNISPKAFTGE